MVDLLENLCKKNEIQINRTQLEKFECYYNFLIEYNKNVNLTSITSKEGVCIKHFLDSIIVAKFINLKGKLIDIGTGAGFPGVPLKIMDDQLDVTLLDSSKKKIRFLELLKEKLDINVKLLNFRTNEVPKEYLRSYDFSIARAVAPMFKLYDFCMPFVKSNGYFIAMKGPSYEEEINNPKFKYSKMSEVCKFSYENNTRVIIKIKNLPKNLRR